MIKSKVQNDVGPENNGNIKFSFLLKVPLFDFALSVGKVRIPPFEGSPYILAVLCCACCQYKHYCRAVFVINFSIE